MRHLILGTAGHIDHGKTALVKALTGVDTDRLPEERRRGMTIELGFAALTVEDCCFGIVDVPGHERFVRTMVAGATGIDVALIVVAADDSVMPQTREHVEILDLLGVDRGVAVVTKIDAVDEEMVELVIDDVRRLLEGTALSGAAICPVSSVTGQGVAELKRAIHQASQAVGCKAAAAPFRMAVDRVFTVRGRGTVVTGSVVCGSVSEGDTLEVWPEGQTCRVRGLQTHGEHAALVASGQRAAINVIGIDRGRLARGMELATPGYLQPTRMVDARVYCLPSCARPLKSTSVVRLEVGATERPVRMVLLEGGALSPGESGFVQLRGGEPFTVVHGQHFILRDESAARTIGGGVILRPNARRRRRDVEDERQALRRLEKGSDADRLEEVLRRHRFNTPSELRICAQTGVELDAVPGLLDALRGGGRWRRIGDSGSHAVPGAVDDLGHRLAGWLSRYHRAHPELPGRGVDAVVGWLERMAGRPLARPLLDELVRNKTVKLFGRFVCLPAFAPSLSAADEKLLAAIIEGVMRGGFQPPALEACVPPGQADRKRLERLATLGVAMGELVRVDQSICLHAATERKLRDAVAALIGRTGRVTVAEVREALGSSRKFVVPFLEYLDRIGFTKRVGDHRVLADDE